MKTAIFTIFLILGLTTCIGSAYTVDTGEVAIISRFGKVVRTEPEGLHFKTPYIEGKTFMSTREETISLQYEVSSKDIQTVLTDVVVQYKIVDAEAVYRSFKADYNNRLLLPRIAEAVQSTSSRYTIEELIEHRQQLASEMAAAIKSDIENYGILITKVSIVNHDFSDSFERAIEEKKVAQQSAQRQQIELEQQLRKAEMTLRIKQEEAKANAVLTQSLSKEVLYKQWLEKWDGRLPQVVSDKSMIQIPAN